MSDFIRNGSLPRSKAVRAPRRLYRALLLAYPHAFRSEFGEEMTQVFAAAYRAAARQDGVPLLRFWCVMLMDLVVTATAERLKESFHMSRSTVARLGGIALLIGSVLQIALLAAQVAITLDFAIAYTDPTGSPWIGRSEVALSLAPALAPLLGLLGLLGLHALGHRRAGAAGMVAITLITVGLVAQAVAGTLASALSWGDLGACISARNCNIHDGTGIFWQAIAVLYVGNLIATLGLLLYGIVTLRARLLLRGNSLPLLLVAASALPYFIVRIALTLAPSPDAAGAIRLDSVLMAGSLAVAIVSFLLGRAILRAASQLSPATAAPASTALAQA